MSHLHSRNYIIIAPQIYISLDPQQPENGFHEANPIQTNIPMVWIQDGNNFRLDIDLPLSGVLDILFPAPITSVHVNGETILDSNIIHPIRARGIHAETSPDGLRLTCNANGPVHILAQISTDRNSHPGISSESPT